MGHGTPESLTASQLADAAPNVDARVPVCAAPQDGRLRQVLRPFANVRVVRGTSENSPALMVMGHLLSGAPAGLGRRRRPCGQLNDFVCCFNAVIHGYPDYRVAFLNHHSSLFGSFSGRV